MARKQIVLPYRQGQKIYYLYRPHIEVEATIAFIEKRRIVISFIHPKEGIMIRRVILHKKDRENRINLLPGLFDLDVLPRSKRA